jgi:hypothetical protein
MSDLLLVFLEVGDPLRFHCVLHAAGRLALEQLLHFDQVLSGLRDRLDRH